mmetsp:Transcript_4199/g.6417  ORF Transcript_4199/g.6417 Transcript_4199/m.6417 type:complete len:731 (+) Transcript_4199:102-2294(+)
MAVQEPIDTSFPCPPRGNFTLTLCPTNGLFYMFGGEYYDGSENLVFDELLRWNPDFKADNNDEQEGANENKSDSTDNNNNIDSYDTGKWTRILTPAPTPPPRCAHSAVFHNDGIYIFGGEMATAEKYHHYKDLWRLDVKNNTWEECKSRGGSPPAARSGHRAVAWRHYMIIFGGFQEELRADTRWFNDVHIFDFQTNIWCELKYNKLARLPPARSACNMTVCADALFIYGGYSKLKNANTGAGANKSEGITHIDCWMLPLKPLINASKSGPLSGASPPSWERISRKGEYPSQRAGTSAVLHKNKLLVFGGVLDSEGDQHKMESVFYDDLFALDMERRRWFAMRLKKTSGGGRRRKKKDNQDDSKVENDGGNDSDNSEEEDEEVPQNDAEAISSGWDLDKLRHDMFAFIDGNGNIVYEKIEDEDGDGEDDSNKIGEEEKTKEAPDPPTDATPVGKTVTKEKKQVGVKNVDKIDASAVMQVDSKGLPSTVTRHTPLPRINCAVAIKGNTLYIYGGVVEVGDREVTLDDCWSIDLNKRDKWTCIWPGQMHKQVWKGVDDDDSYISSDQGGDDDEDSLDEDFELDPIHEDDVNNDEKMTEEERKKAKKAAKKAKEKEKRRGVRHEITELKEKLGVDNAQRTPQMGESVAEFYARTTEYWSVEAAKSAGVAAADSGERLSTKELAREGFLLAKERYEQLKPMLQRLDELEAMQQEGAEEKHKKKDKKKSSKKDRR